MSDNNEQHGIDTPEEVVEIILMAQAHHDKIREKLGLVLEHKDAPIQLQGGDGEPTVIEPDTDVHKGIRVGIQIALSMIGEFPIKLTKHDEHDADEEQ